MLELCALLSAVGQAGAGAETGTGLGGGISMAPVVLRLVGSMALIFLLIFVLVILFRRYGRSLSPQAALGRHVEVLGSVTIESKKRIYLVRIFDRVILMGAGPMGLTALAEFDDETIEEQLKGVEGFSPKPLEDFRQLFRKLSANIQSLKGAETS
jgi:flagellar biogenesis protein FliO